MKYLILFVLFGCGHNHPLTGNTTHRHSDDPQYRHKQPERKGSALVAVPFYNGDAHKDFNRRAMEQFSQRTEQPRDDYPERKARHLNQCRHNLSDDYLTCLTDRKDCEGYGNLYQLEGAALSARCDKIYYLCRQTAEADKYLCDNQII